MPSAPNQGFLQGNDSLRRGVACAHPGSVAALKTHVNIGSTLTSFRYTMVFGRVFNRNSTDSDHISVGVDFAVTRTRVTFGARELRRLR